MASTQSGGRGRRRLGVAVVLDPPEAGEVDGLRRALGDPSLGRIPPHVTLVPPVNVRRDDLPEALALLRDSAASVPPRIELTIGRVSTFLPVNPVAYLSVGGDLDALARLRDHVFRGPLARALSWPWVPHVTLADGVPEERIRAALEALQQYAAVARADRVVLLEEGPGRAWSPLADAGLGPAVRVGTGGLPLVLSRGRLVDPRLAAPPPAPSLVAPVAITAYREGEPVGYARATVDARGPATVVHVRDEYRGQGIGSHLRAHLDWVLARREEPA
jgi:2'-5' RNA ligase